MVQRRFDHANRETLVSFPLRSIAAYNSSLNSTTYRYDGLGRLDRVQSNSELGILTTTYQFLLGLRTQVTDPRGNITTIFYQAFDQPSSDHPKRIDHPGGGSTLIARDVFGKPTTITRSGTWSGGSQSLARRFVYDEHERLCKRHDPESGWTVMDYDASSNIAWSATGQNLTSLTDCQRTSVAANQRSTRSYDGRNRLTGIAHPAGTASVNYSYYADGAMQTASTTATGTMPASTWSYQYNRRRMMTQESLAISGLTLPVNHYYTHNGHHSSTQYPDGSVNNTGPNALGEPTRAGNWATNVSYHPNGAVAGFNYGDGHIYSLTLNTRQLPLRRREVRNGSVLLDYSYGYDGNGNMTALNDLRSGVETRTMVYDNLDRLTQTSGVLGPEIFKYDALDNLREMNYPGRNNLSITYGIPAGTNRLSSIFMTDGQQSLTHTYQHDGRGNLTSGVSPFAPHPVRTQGFDLANRMAWSTVSGQTEQYAYDAHGRRTRIQRSGGATIQLYGRDGKLLYERAPNGQTTRHAYLGQRLVASIVGSTVTYQHTDHLGSPVQRTNASGGSTGHVIFAPFGSIQAGSQPQGPGFTGHVQDAGSGLVYMQQRYHDPLAMRFVSVDPVLTSTVDGSNFNRYWYANNNPYKYVDPDGRAVCVAFPPAPICAGAAKAIVDGLTLLIGGAVVYNEIVEDAATPQPAGEGTESEARPIESDRNPADDHRLSKGEIKALEGGGEDVHELKGGKDASKRDLFKDGDGNIYAKPKSGSGPGEPTGLNIKDFKIK